MFDCAFAPRSPVARAVRSVFMIKRRISSPFLQSGDVYLGERAVEAANAERVLVAVLRRIDRGRPG